MRHGYNPLMRRVVLVLLVLGAAVTAACDVLESSRIEGAVLKALAADSRTGSYEYQVSYQGDGQVVITGEVSNPAEVDAVTEVALGVDGVTLVVNNCHVEEHGSGLIQDEVVPSPFF